jgi:hypothetical protein
VKVKKVLNVEFREVVVIGAGPVGIALSNFFSSNNISCINLIPSTPIKFTNVDSKFELSENSQSGKMGGNSIHWGNQHDPNLQMAWKSNSFSNLDAYPFEFEELSSINEILISLGYPPLHFSKNFSLGTEIIGNFHYVGSQSLVKPLDHGQYFEIEVGSITFSRHQNLYRIQCLRNLQGEVFEQTLDSRYIFFASGGISNVYFVEKIHNDLGIEIPLMNGKGYVNHPKFISHEISLRSYEARRLIKKRSLLSKKWREYPVFDVITKSGLRVSFRFWTLPRFNRNAKTRKFKKIHRILLKGVENLSPLRSLNVVCYFELPQMKENSIDFVSYDSKNHRMRFRFNLDFPEKVWREIHNSIEVFEKWLIRNFRIKEIKRQNFSVLESALQDSNHHMGTTRIGKRANNSVVNQRCELHSLERVYCVGTSVLSTGSSNHPTHIAIGIALIAAKEVVDTIRAYGQK